MEKETKSKSYHLYAHSYWYYPIFLVVYIVPIILIAIYLNDIEKYFGESVIPYIFFGIIIIHYYSAGYIARKYSHQPVRVRFDDEKITVDTFSKDLGTLKKSASCNLQEIVSFKDFNFNSSQFKLLLKNGETFALYESGWKLKESDFDDLVKDFKIHIQLLNPKNTSNIVKYDNFYTSKLGKVLLVLSLGVFLGGIGLLIYVSFFVDEFKVSTLKLPAFMVIGSLVYIGGYFGEGEE